jgi:hypothetical protein
MPISSFSANCAQVFKCMVGKVNAEGCKRACVLVVEVMVMLPTSAQILAFSSGARTVLCV